MKKNNHSYQKSKTFSKFSSKIQPLIFNQVFNFYETKKEKALEYKKKTKSIGITKNLKFYNGTLPEVKSEGLISLKENFKLTRLNEKTINLLTFKRNSFLTLLALKYKT